MALCFFFLPSSFSFEPDWPPIQASVSVCDSKIGNSWSYLFTQVPRTGNLRYVGKNKKSTYSHWKRYHTVDDEQPFNVSVFGSYSGHHADCGMLPYHCQPLKPPRPPSRYTASMRYPENILAIPLLVWNIHERFASSSLRYQDPMMYCIPG